MANQVNAHPASQRGVDREALPLSLRGLRCSLSLLRRVSRPAAVSVVTRLFVTPRRHDPPASEAAVVERTRRERVSLSSTDGGEHELALFRLEGPSADAPIAVLVHGWEGRGSQLHAFAEPLVACGFEVVFFDHVGHGESSGRRSSLITMRDGLAAVVCHLGPERVRAVVAHSMGSAATSLVLDGGEFPWSPPRLAYVAPPYDLVVYFGHYLELVMGDQDLLPDMLARMERRYGIGLDDIHYDFVLPRRSEPLLVLHSADDQDVPLAGGRLVAERWPGARIDEFDGLGHRRVLRDPRVVQSAAVFLAGGAGECAPRSEEPARPGAAPHRTSDEVPPPDVHS